MKSSPRLPQLEKARVEKQRPKAAKNKLKKKKRPKGFSKKKKKILKEIHKIDCIELFYT